MKYRTIPILLAAASALYAADAPAFDVVSVKHVGSAVAIRTGPGAMPQVTAPFRYVPGKVTCRLPLHEIIREAWHLEEWQVRGPEWLELENYELAATMPESTSRENARLMLRTMLAERFGLQFHREPQEIPVYALVVGKGGLKLQEIPKPELYSYRFGPGAATGTTRFYAEPAMPIAPFAAMLRSPAGRPVLDQTGLAGFYKIDVEWNRDPQERNFSGVLATLPKLGLKLEPQKKIYDVLIVDKASKEPTAN